MCRSGWFLQALGATALTAAVLLCGVHEAAAADPASVEAAVVAARSAPGLLEAGKAVARVPLSASEILRLPLGAGEIILSPLPGIKAKDGFANVGSGMLAPFKCAIDVLALPYRVLDSLSKPNNR